MPIRPQDLIDALPVFVSEDRPCVRCGYNLKGLRTTGNCPECGRPISKHRRGPRRADDLVHAPMPWLQAFKAGAVLLMLSSAAFVIVQLVGNFARDNVPGLVAAVTMGAAIGWWGGVVLVTRPRPVLPNTDLDPRAEWFMLRLVSRITQAGWPLLVGVGIVIVRMVTAAAAAIAATPVAVAAGTAAPPPVGGPPTWLYWIAGVAAFAAAGGLVALCIYLSNICFWAADSTLALNFRACAFSVTAAAVTGVLLVVRVLFGPAMAGPAGGMSAAITWPILIGAAFFIMLATGHLLWCLWRLQSLADWAVVHHITAEGKDERMRERAERLLAEQKARRGR